MGLCMSRCYSEVSRLSCWKINAGIEDRDRLIDQPAPRPLSISSWLSCVRGQVRCSTSHPPFVCVIMLSLENELHSSDVSLLHGSDSEDSDVLFKLGVDNEELELQEEVVVEACKEADKIKQIAENSTELINPAKLALETTALWERFDVGDKESKFRDRGESSNEKHLKDHASCSSPSSSVELEWENEDGLSPVTHLPGRDDSSSDTASCLSELSTPVSNGNEELEWDGHFTSTHISQLDMETERLISEIERLTTGALQGQTSDR
ncbi:uncharacterized protein TNIN_175961 [Trichonephila inaurata madagascariensis]|uniref:Uncharacterized protein n=1 Tax=Trichonephila inaurata madagascariensis TaxID=2747483 RepID=A0A8X6XIA9_9ARAC|nr:uncharacterized protein TNIN_175961 [Trichonephila inaurata madagascariensis]